MRVSIYEAKSCVFTENKLKFYQTKISKYHCKCPNWCQFIELSSLVNVIYKTYPFVLKQMQKSLKKNCVSTHFWMFFFFACQNESKNSRISTFTRFKIERKTVLLLWFLHLFQHRKVSFIYYINQEKEHYKLASIWTQTVTFTYFEIVSKIGN